MDFYLRAKLCPDLFYRSATNSSYCLHPTFDILLLSYRRETALQGALVLAKSGRLELGDNILRTL